MDWPQDFPPLKKLLQITRLCSATTGSNLLMLSRCGYSTIACGSCCGITPAPKMSSVAQPQAKPAEPAPNFLLLCLFKGPFVRDSVASDGGEAGRKGCRSLNTSTHRPATSGDILSYWFISFAKIWAELRTGILQLLITSTWTLKNNQMNHEFILMTLPNWKYFKHYLNSIPFLFNCRNPGPLELGTGQNKLGRPQGHGGTDPSDRGAGRREESVRSPECRLPPWCTQPCIDSWCEVACRQ